MCPSSFAIYWKCVQVELAALEYRSSRLVRVLDAATGQRMGFGEGGATEVVSARWKPAHPPDSVTFVTHDSERL